MRDCFVCFFFWNGFSTLQDRFEFVVALGWQSPPVGFGGQDSSLVCQFRASLAKARRVARVRFSALHWKLDFLGGERLYSRSAATLY
jgi:hypothetical protein